MEYQESILEIINNNRDNLVELRNELFSIFNKSENKNYDTNNSTIEQNEEITRWIKFNEIHFVGWDKTEGKRVFINETDKISFLDRNYCNICEDKLPVQNFPVRITPMTRQTSTEFKNEFKKRFSESPFGKKHYFTKDDKLCIKIIFILNNVRDKDLDNMAKLTLDALKELIGIDDKNIDHLELLKIKAIYFESSIQIRISKSDLNTSDNVILKGTHMSWAGLPKLDE